MFAELDGKFLGAFVHFGAVNRSGEDFVLELLLDRP
jgi:hypothetical protein